MNDNRSTNVDLTTEPAIAQNGGYVQPFSEVFNEDCIQVMKRYPDKFFDLAVVDPPYGIGESKSNFESRGVSSEKWKRGKPKIYEKKDWDNEAPNAEYWNELFRVSKNQIVWGANHFISRIPYDSSCWLVWDKDTSGDYADCEIAWTSFKTSIRRIKLTWSGFRKCEVVDRFHPTQKPVKLYDWVLSKYASKGNLILDTHLGSGSSRIAAHKAGLSFVGCEIDKDYFDAQEKRFKEFVSQLRLF
jgi:site-specific DNA-methyltransferase (adenine-specific)